MPSSAFAFLRCPRCHLPFVVEPASLRCAAGHRFDLARQGYANLALGSRLEASADTLRMVDARQAFFAAGHFEPLTRAITSIASALLRRADPSLCILDAGAGPGHHLARILEAAPERFGVALDLSKIAMRRAARAHPRMAAAVADLTRPLPLGSETAALALSVFAPRPAQELWRVLAPSAALLVVTPGPTHLNELIGPMGMIRIDPDKEARLLARMKPWFDPANLERIEYRLALSRAEVATLVRMGPNAFHLSDEQIHERAQVLTPPVEITVAFQLRWVIKRGR